MPRTRPPWRAKISDLSNPMRNQIDKETPSEELMARIGARDRYAFESLGRQGARGVISNAAKFKVHQKFRRRGIRGSKGCGGSGRAKKTAAHSRSGIKNVMHLSTSTVKTPSPTLSRMLQQVDGEPAITPQTPDESLKLFGFFFSKLKSSFSKTPQAGIHHPGIIEDAFFLQDFCQRGVDSRRHAVREFCPGHGWQRPCGFPGCAPSQSPFRLR